MNYSSSILENVNMCPNTKQKYIIYYELKEESCTKISVLLMYTKTLFFWKIFLICILIRHALTRLIKL